MKNYILFSPVGSTDPIRDDFDGPMLHIVRHYRPRKVYIFLTAEMAKRDRKKDIYAWTLKQLDPKIEIEKIYHDDITNPQVMDKFDEYYPQDLQKIYHENPNCEILANVTSGTAQMMTSLRIFAAQADFPIRLIAVDTHAKKSNHSKPVDDNYDKELCWRNDLDNSVGETENRCKEIHHDNIKKAIMKSIIDKHIGAYNYRGAIIALQQAEGLFCGQLQEMLNGANLRIRLEHDKAKQCFENTDLKYKDVYPVQSSDCRDIFEYILRLKRLGGCKQFLEFAQGFSPVLFKLSYAFLKKALNVPIDAFTKVDRKDVRHYDEGKIPDKYKMALNKEFGKMNYDTPLNTANLLPLIACEVKENNSEEANAYKKIDCLRKFEKDVRNIAAHEIRAISEATFDTNASTSYQKLIADFKALYQIIFGGYTDWDSYDNMNNKIREYI